MDRPLTYEGWKQFQSEAKSKGWKLSNCYLLPAELRRMTEAGVLTAQLAENALYLLEDAGSFCRCYYFLSPTETPGIPRLDREAVVEFPFTGEPNSGQLLQIARLKELGFVLARESGLMSCEAEALISRTDLDPTAVHAARADEVPEIAALLAGSFDPRFSFLPTREELSQAVEAGTVFAVSRDGRLAGALVSGFEKSAATVHQVAVDQAFRGAGLGSLLLEAYHRHYAGLAKVFRHWVDLHNVPALAMYRSFGYGFSLRKANEYTLAPNN